MKLKILICLHLIVFLSWSCEPELIDEPSPNPNTNQPPTPTFKYLALGDSYTIGEAVAVNERYPIQLRDNLFTVDTEEKAVSIIAQTGWTTDELQTAIDGNLGTTDTFDLVSLLIGVNNQFRGYSIDDYKVEFRSLLHQAIGFAGDDTSKVFVVSIPDYAYTPYGDGDTNISQGIDDYNAINKDISDELGVQYFNITSISREGLNDPELVALDGLHPSGKQYTQWVELMLPTVRLMIE